MVVVIFFGFCGFCEWLILKGLCEFCVEGVELLWLLGCRVFRYFFEFLWSVVECSVFFWGVFRVVVVGKCCGKGVFVRCVGKEWGVG